LLRPAEKFWMNDLEADLNHHNFFKSIISTTAKSRRQPEFLTTIQKGQASQARESATNGNDVTMRGARSALECGSASYRLYHR
jgi:hypothetical protein